MQFFHRIGAGCGWLKISNNFFLEKEVGMGGGGALEKRIIYPNKC